MKMKKLLFFLMMGLIFLSSCGKEDDDDDSINSASTYYYILNEGNFGMGNADVSLFDAKAKTITNNVFNTKNGRHLGDVAQSVSRYNGKLYFVLNNSNKIEIAAEKTCAELAVIKGLNLPRFIAFTNNSTAWVSCWGENGMVSKVDLNTNKVVDSVATGTGPEELLMDGNNLWVANSGGFMYDSTLSIINTLTSQKISTVEVGSNPASMVKDKNGKIWVLCRGRAIYDDSWTIIGHEASELVQLNPTNYAIEKRITLFADQHPSKLQINAAGDKLFFGAGYDFNGIYSLNISDVSFANQKVINGIYYGFRLEPTSGDFYCLDAGNFQTAGSLKLFSSVGNLLGTYTAGLGPNSVEF